MEWKDVTVEYRDVTVEVDARTGGGEIPNLYNIMWNLVKVACERLPPAPHLVAILSSPCPPRSPSASSSGPSSADRFCWQTTYFVSGKGVSVYDGFL